MLDAFEALLAQLLQPTAAAASTSPTHAAVTSVCPSPLNASLTRYAGAGTDGADGKPSVARSLFPCPGGAFAQASANSFTGPSAGLSSGPGSGSSQGSSPVSRQGSASPLAHQGQPSLAARLVAFDDSWVEYLDQFVVWKGRDAVGLEQELMRMAVRLERSMRLKLGRRELDSPEVRANPDLQVSTGCWCWVCLSWIWPVCASNKLWQAQEQVGRLGAWAWVGQDKHRAR
jgi:hypothetical protein